MRDIISEFNTNNKDIISHIIKISENIQKVEMRLGAKVTCYDKSIESDFLYYEIQVTKNYKPSKAFGFIGIHFNDSNMVIRNLNDKENTAYLIANISKGEQISLIEDLKAMKDSFFDFYFTVQ
jgi:hypothetical protein